MLHSKLQFILVETMWRIYDLPRIKSVKQLFQMTEKLIEDQKEINDLTTIDYTEFTWRSTTLLWTMLLRPRMPKPMSSPTRYSV